MTAPGEKTKKKKKRKCAKGVHEYFVREKTAKHTCAICQSLLHGVPHGKKKSEVSRMSKTKKRPSVAFGGVLCGKCRRTVAEERAKFENNLKAADEIDFKIMSFISAGVEKR